MFFATKIDTRSKRAMADALAGHYRYDTMSSWNRSTSYAQCIKVHHIGLDREQEAAAFNALDVSDFWWRIKGPIRAFTDEWAGCYTIGTNGRSGGYLVLYQARRRPSEYKSWCPSCGQRNFQPVSESSHLCGVCHEEREDFAAPLMELDVYPGKSLDQSMSSDDFMEWSIGELRDRWHLVNSFDRACDAIRDNFIDLITTYKVVEKTIQVDRTICVFEPA